MLFEFFSRWATFTPSMKSKATEIRLTRPYRSFKARLTMRLANFPGVNLRRQLS